MDIPRVTEIRTYHTSLHGRSRSGDQGIAPRACVKELEAVVDNDASRKEVATSLPEVTFGMMLFLFCPPSGKKIRTLTWHC